MKNKNKSVMMFLFGVFAALGAFADDVSFSRATWTDSTGDHRWDNAANWEPKEVATWRNEIHIPTGTWTIDIGTGERFYGPLIIDDGSGSVTFTGGGTLLRSSYADLSVGAGRELIVDGCTVPVGGSLNWNGATLRVRSGVITMDNAATLGGTCRVCVEGGVFGGSGNIRLSITNNASLIISGGLAHLHSYKVYGPDEPGESGGLIRLTGGALHNDTDFASYHTKIVGGRFENLGGTVFWGNSSEGSGGNNRLSSESGDYGAGETFALYLPPVGAILDIPSTTARNELGALRFAVPGDYSFGGTVFVTNATEEARSACVYFGDGDDNNNDEMTVNVSGGATVFANTIRTKKYNKQNLDFSRVNLGQGGINLAPESKMRFVNDVVFGAWGDWSVAFGNSKTFLLMAGAVTFDTLDCFDTTKHTIGMKADIAEATELKAVGGGTVTLTAQTEKNELRLIEVGARTTFNLTGKMKTMNLTLGDEATLGLDISSGGYLDAAATASFGEGAKIVVTAVPATLTAKMLYSVYSAPAGTEADLANVEITVALPEGWKLAKSGNSIFLTDGQTMSDETPKGSTYSANWSGGGANGNFLNADNWVESKVPSAAWQGYFYGCHNLKIELNSDIVLRMLIFCANSGPFVIGGTGVFAFEYPGSSYGYLEQASLRNDGRFPIVVANAIKNNKEGNAIWAQSFSEGSIAAIGGMDTVNIPFCFGGDIRVGGAWQVADLRAQQCYGGTVAARMSRLTVMPDATFEVRNQTAAQPFNTVGYAGLSVAANATATVSGTQFLMESNNVHYIDGMRTVNCPLTASARQTFLGDGTLQLAEATGELALEGAMTFVPGSLLGDVSISLKGEPTIAPEENWTYAGETELSLEGHSKLTLATGGYNLTLAKPLVSEGTLVFAGPGKVVLDTMGISVGKVVCRDGAMIALGDNLGAANGFVDVLTVRDLEPAPVFDERLQTKVRYDAEIHRYIYSVKPRLGLRLIFR